MAKMLSAPTIVAIDQLAVPVRVGVLPEERRFLQTLYLDIRMQIPPSATRADGIANDDLAATVDYGAVAAHLVRELGHDHFKLIERVAQRCAETIIASFDVIEVGVRVIKPDALAHANAAWTEISLKAPPE